MANELQANAGSANTGLTTYFVVWNAVGQVRSTGTTFDTDNATNRNAGVIAATESVNGVYKATSPAFAAGVYSYALYSQAGGSPAVTDTLLAGPGDLQWDGSAVVPLSRIAADLPQRVTKNTALANFMFTMRNTSGVATAGLTVTATRSLDGAAFAACANSVSAVGNGWYKINLDATDTNGDIVALRFTATGALDTNLTIPTQPT